MVAGTSRLMAFNGHDQMLLAGLVMDAGGGIGSFYNLKPERLGNLYCAFKQGDLETARREQAAINGIGTGWSRRCDFSSRCEASIPAIAASRRCDLTADEEAQLAGSLEVTAFQV